MRRQPPYSKHMTAVMSRPATWRNFSGTSADGKHLTLRVMIGPKAWDVTDSHAAQRNLFVLLPHGDDPAAFNWRVLRGHPPVLVIPNGEVDAHMVTALVLALIRDGVERVLYMADEGMHRYIAEARHVA